jgi:penicillin-binding protein 1C
MQKILAESVNSSSWPGKSAKRVFAHMSRPSTSLACARKKDVDARDKPGHDEQEFDVGGDAT